MKYRLQLKLLLASSFLGLTACAGGGGGSGGSAGPTPFTSWSAMGPNSTTVISGGSATVTSGGAITQTMSGASVTASLNSSGALSAISFQSAAGNSANFSASNGDVGFYINGGKGYGFVNKGFTQAAIVVNPASEGFEYQSFGAWGGLNTSFAGTSNAISVGSATPVSGMPATGTAIFTGSTAGYFVSGGYSFVTSSDMTTAVNFGTRAMAFATTNSLATVNPVSGPILSAPGLNMSGTMAIVPGTNQFRGSAVANNGISGPIVGQFYGPNANELGGTYIMTGSSGAALGGFGGKR